MFGYCVIWSIRRSAFQAHSMSKSISINVRVCISRWINSTKLKQQVWFNIKIHLQHLAAHPAVSNITFMSNDLCHICNNDCGKLHYNIWLCGFWSIFSFCFCITASSSVALRTSWGEHTTQSDLTEKYQETLLLADYNRWWHMYLNFLMQ